MRYLVAGGIAAAVHFVALVALVEAFGIAPIVSTVIGFSVAVVVNYTLQFYWTFSVTGRHRVMFFRYLAVTLLMLAVNTALFWLFHGHLRVGYLLAQVCATTLVTAMNFEINRRYTFRRDD